MGVVPTTNVVVPPVAFNVVPVKDKPVPSVISSITPVPAVALPISLLVLTEVVIVPLVVIVPPDINPAVAMLVTVPLLLNVVQSAALKAPLFKALAVGTLRVITGVVVLLATVELRSVPVVPNVKADTFVTVPVGIVGNTRNAPVPST